MCGKSFIEMWSLTYVVLYRFWISESCFLLSLNFPTHTVHSWPRHVSGHLGMLAAFSSKSTYQYTESHKIFSARPVKRPRHACDNPEYKLAPGQAREPPSSKPKTSSVLPLSRNQEGLASGSPSST